MKRVMLRCIFCAALPAVVVGGALLFRERHYAFVSLAVALLALFAFFLRFERAALDVRRLVLLAALTALSVTGRMLFAPLPGFKPVTAMVVITGVAFGGEAGFLTGAFSALLSNFYFGQGPWTPFQMLCWGLIGLAAGRFSGILRRSPPALAVCAVLSGVAYSCGMDVWTVLWADGGFSLSRYFAALASSLPFTAVYALSNLLFLLLFARPIWRILDRFRQKYAL